MLKKFSTKQMVYVALIGALWFILDFLIGQWVNALTGLYLIGAALSAIIAGFFAVVLVKTMPKFGTFTLALLIFGLLAFPTASAGPAGFWPKILINALAGFGGDIVMKLTKYKNWGIFPTFYILYTLLAYALTFALILAGVPESAKILSVMHFVVIAGWVLGTLGIFAGFAFYNKIKNKRILRQIQD